MKNTLLPLALLCAFAAFGQTPAAKPEKLRYNVGFFSTRYELGNKDVKAREVRLHLEKHDAAAYHLWRRAEGASRAGLGWSLAGLAGALVGAFATDNAGVSAAGWGVCAVGLTGGLVCSLNEKKRRERAIDGYNRKFGY